MNSTLVICGTGRCLFDDMARLPDRPYDMMALNYTGALLRWDFRHWVCGDSRLFRWLPCMREHRTHNGKPYAIVTYQAHAPCQDPGTEIHVTVWPELPVFNSGPFGARVGLALGYREIILAGCPFDASGYFWDGPNDPPIEDYVERNSLEPWLALKGQPIKSMSGNTREIFGDP